MVNPLLLSADQTGALLGVSRSRIYELARLGILPHVRLGRQLRVSRKALEMFVAEGGCGLWSAPRQKSAVKNIERLARERSSAAAAE